MINFDFFFRCFTLGSALRFCFALQFLIVLNLDLKTVLFLDNFFLD